MYKAIIIDDEPWTIIDIEKTFSLEDMGFEIVGSYRTPQKALPAIISKKTRPGYYRYPNARNDRNGTHQKCP